MKIRLVVSGFLFFQVLMMACSASESAGANPRLESEISAIEALMENYVSGYQSKDVDSFVNVFTADAIRMPPNGTAIVGSDKVRAYYEDWFAKESLDVVVTPREIQVVGDWAYAWGTYESSVTLTENEATRADRGKFLNIYKKGADGSWRFHRNIWNSDLPVSTGD
jgi:uncharacterized protein (TIGR02246 family)